MNTVSIRGLLKRTPNGYMVIPATKCDYTMLSMYSDKADGKYISMEFKGSRGTKSYAQIKTAWALITYIFIATKGYKPTKEQAKQLEQELLNLYGDTKASILKEGETVPLGMSEMNKMQLARFIQSLVQHLHECCMNSLLSADDMVNVQEVFAEWQSYISLQEVDPTDFDENGEYLSLEDYRRTHPISYASGRTTDASGSPLEIAHIVSRGSDPAFANCCWNVMMLTHEEHLEIMHEEGWNGLIARYPHIRGRVERAFNMAHHLYKVIDKDKVEL